MTKEYGTCVQQQKHSRHGGGDSIQKFARAPGSGKLMFSSDMPQNTPVELPIFNAVFTSDEDRRKVFRQTACDAFRIN